MNYVRSLNVDKVLAIVGPTGIGKTKLSIQCAKRWNGQIISADSMQVYQKMDIGTAKVTPKEQQGIPHYLVDAQSYDQPYNVKIFQDKCRQAIANIKQAHCLPIICGGTGLYLKAALYDYVFEEEQDDPVYTKYLHTLTNEELVQQLKQVDPKSLEKIHPHNRKRLIRALQICHSGETKSSREAKQEHVPLYDVYFLGLDMDREQLHQRIDQRVDQMFDAGLVKEVTTLFSDPKTWEYTSFQGIGYKEFRAYFQKEMTLDQVKEKIKTDSRRYAKRQYTWFKHQMDVHWFQPDDPKIIPHVEAWLQEGK